MRTDAAVVSHSVHTDSAILTLVLHTIIHIHLTELPGEAHRTPAAERDPQKVK